MSTSFKTPTDIINGHAHEGDDGVIRALKSGILRGVLLQDVCFPSQDDHGHETPMIAAAYLGLPKTLNWLMSLGHSINKTDNWGASPLYYALTGYRLQQEGAMKVQGKHLDCIRALIAAGADVSGDFPATTGNVYSSWAAFASLPHPERETVLFDWLCRGKNSIHALCQIGEADSSTPRYELFRKCNWEQCERLLALPGSYDWMGKRDALIQEYPDSNREQSHHLFHAAIFNTTSDADRIFAELMQRWIEAHEADENAKVSLSRRRTFMRELAACCLVFGKPGPVRIMDEKSVLFHRSDVQKHQECLRYIRLREGADNPKTMSGALQIVDLFLSRGVDPNVTDKEGYTALDTAIKHRDESALPMIMALVQRGLRCFYWDDDPYYVQALSMLKEEKNLYDMARQFKDSGSPSETKEKGAPPLSPRRRT